MFIKCCNPECERPFAHREGRLVRFSKDISSGQPIENQRSIQHYWLCGKCAELFVFDYDSEMNIRIKPRNSELTEGRRLFYSTAAA